MSNVIPLRVADNSELIDRMAADLIRFEATATESDAIRSLMCTRRYGTSDIATLIDDALAAARQAIVTAEMARAS